MQAAMQSLRETHEVGVSGIVVDDDVARFNVVFRLTINRNDWDTLEAMAKEGERVWPASSSVNSGLI
jgi:hypothetical protein